MYRNTCRRHIYNDREYPTCSPFSFLVMFFALAPLLLAAVSPVSGLDADGETDVMMVGCTIHCKSGLVEMAVTVGTNGATGAS